MAQTVPSCRFGPRLESRAAPSRVGRISGVGVQVSIPRNVGREETAAVRTRKNEAKGIPELTPFPFSGGKWGEIRETLGNFLTNLPQPKLEATNLLSQSLKTALSASLALLCTFELTTADASALSEAEGFAEPVPFSELTTPQRTLVEVWGIVRETYVDRSFNNQDWDKQLQNTLVPTLSSDSPDYAYDQIRDMLTSLGDPFTRFVSPKDYANFRISNDGALEGVGLLIASEPGTGRKIVLSPIEGGPADRAGIHSGDEIIQINDETVFESNGDEVINKLRGKAGTSVSITYRRTTENEEDTLTQVQLRRETITISPVFSTLLSHAGDNGEETKTGYIRLSNFSQNAAEDMAKAVIKLENQGASNYILDLRNNPGGLVRAGLEIAQIWLDGDEILVNTIDREGNTRPVLLRNGHSLTHQPLAILVNNGSASASEILAGALHDNGRAILIGDKTYGKGKIQSVFELGDGSALFVTVAKYLSPALNQIDLVGITPDVGCLAEATPVANQPPEGQTSNGLLFIDVTAQLQSDKCILTAENRLEHNSN